MMRQAMTELFQADKKEKLKSSSKNSAQKSLKNALKLHLLEVLSLSPPESVCSIDKKFFLRSQY